jgi:hypothetical protein
MWRQASAAHPKLFLLLLLLPAPLAAMLLQAGLCWGR